MAPHLLDNPIWASLTTSHRDLAQGSGDPLRYPAAVAPFLGSAGEAPLPTGALDALVPAGDTALMLGAKPDVPASHRLDDLGRLSQMVCDGPLPEVDGPPIIALNQTHPSQVLELTALVYPHYFRPRTIELGRYFGILENGRLAAMIGERMGLPGYRELSAVCTHPDFLGRGYARRLIAWLANDNLARGQTPFLHVSPTNPRAMALYDQNGFRTRQQIAFWSLTKVS